MEDQSKPGRSGSNGEEAAKTESGGQLEVSHLEMDAAQFTLDIQKSADQIESRGVRSTNLCGQFSSIMKTNVRKIKEASVHVVAVASEPRREEIAADSSVSNFSKEVHQI